MIPAWRFAGKGIPRVSSFDVESPTRYTREWLIREADLIRPGATARLITDWITLGLVDGPHKPGLGRGQGSEPGTWSEDQKMLFLTVWAKRAEASIRDLCNIPVYLWLWWGDHHVPLPQARRALASWAGRNNVSSAAADATAAQLLEDFGGGTVGRATRELLAEAIRGRRPDLDQMRDQLALALGKPVVVSPDGALPVEVGPDMMMEVFEGRLAALGQLNRIDPHIFEWARFTCLLGSQAYGRDQPALAAHPRYPGLFPKLDHQTLMARACLTLLTVLGMALKDRGGQEGTLEDPATWVNLGLMGTIRQTRVSPGGLSVLFDVDRRPGRPP
jgi:hypothetical protein